jgi:hypothetical protein
MSRLSQAFAFFNLEPEKFTPEWTKFNMTHVKIDDKMKELRRLHRKEQRKEAKNHQIEAISADNQAINQEESDLKLVLEGKMTKEEFRAKWVK